MSKQPTCDTCIHLYDGECHRYPPQVTVIIAPQPGNIASGGRPTMGPVPVAAFPPIANPKDCGCSEHETGFALAH